MNSGKKTFLFFCLFCVFLLNAGSALSFEVRYPDFFGKSLNDTSTIGDYICYLFNLGVTLVISLTSLVIVYGGVLYLISYARGSFTSNAKEWVKAGITGLLIVVCASLIANTINPALTSCKVGILSQVSLDLFDTGPVVRYGASTATYQEIPIGTLTETLLTRTMDCYGFDQQGNPVDGEEKTKNLLDPTYTDHDRADCLTQLIDGSQKKSQIIAALSEEITKLMDLCDCGGRCNPACGGTDCQVQGCPGGTCGGSCVGGLCQQPPNTTDCCPDGVKDKIERGPIKVSVSLAKSSSGEDSCQTEDVEYKGLDEFRCPNPNGGGPCSGLPDYVEKKVQINNETTTVIDQDKWKKLNLWQQLKYFEEKIYDINRTIEEDKDLLDNAGYALSDCYLAMPYADFVATHENTDQQNTIILIQKTFSDPITGDKINASKYCQGFNYANSSCLKKCNDMCPDIEGDYSNIRQCQQNNQNCLKNQEKDMEEAFNSRPCPYASGDNAPENFENCITSCQDDCSEACGKKYLQCSDEYDFCDSQCNDNGQCVLNNAGSCLFGAQAFRDCADKITDQGNTNYCLNRAYLCKNGSNEYAGYPACAVPVSDNCPAEKYSASFFYDNKNCQKCPQPYSPPVAGSVCYSEKASSTSSCMDLCPEVAKCPSASKCPDCKCDQINETLYFSIPDNCDRINPADYLSALEASCPGCQNIRNRPVPAYENIDGEYGTSQQKISANQMVGSQCNGYSYNDDPLTFYCEINPLWYNNPNKETVNPKPMGLEKVCPKTNEVPIGQAVDDSKNWADKLINDTEKIGESLQKMLSQMEKIGKAKNTSPVQDYCKCNARVEDGKSICTTDCQYNQHLTEQGWVCTCTFVPCNGSPCQQITDYLSELWNDYGKLKLDFTDFYTNVLKEPRSDIFKELAYSRLKTSECGRKSTSHGLQQARLLNCTRVKDEIMPPINTGEVMFNGQTTNVGCYGKDLGVAVEKSLTDNWFCCEQWAKNPSTNNNPIYNIKK